MAWSGSAGSQTYDRTNGTHSGATTWAQDEAAATGITTARHDLHDADIATAINLCLKKDGGNTLTAAIPTGGYGFTGMGVLGSATEVEVASTGTCNILATTSLLCFISGTSTVTSFGTGANRIKFVRATGIFQITASSAIITPTGTNITTAVGDNWIVVSDGSSNARMFAYQSSGGSLSGTTASYSGNVSAGTFTEGGTLLSAKYQAKDADLTTIAANITAAGLAILDDANAAAQRSTLGLGTAALKDTGQSGDTVPTLDSDLTFSATTTFYRNVSSNISAKFIAPTTGVPAQAHNTGGAGETLFAWRAANGSTIIGSVSNSGNTAVLYNTTSDGRLKTPEGPIADSGLMIDQLQPIYFRWKAEPDAGPGMGLIAQDAYAVHPQFATPGRFDQGAENFQPWSVDYSKFVPLLLAEVKSLRARIAKLELKAGE